jgi:Glycosyl-4,4'-diaponeurosporenoate acyltransferase
MQKLISFSLSITIISWLVGMAINALLRKTDFHKRHLTNLNFVKSKKLNKLIGIPAVKWVVKNTFFKFFNQKLKVEKKPTLPELIKLREEMTTSEVDHLIGFLFVTFFALAKIYNQGYLAGLIIMIVNILMNLYPSLLQQENKRRIDVFIRRFPSDIRLYN